MTEPGYLNEASSSSTDESRNVAAMDEPVNRLKPSKKASMLKVLSTPRRKLTVQGAGVQVRAGACATGTVPPKQCTRGCKNVAPAGARG